MNDLPYITDPSLAVGAGLRERPEDFVVEEIPLYPACGEGTWVYATIEKRGIPTPTAVDRFSRALGRPRRDVGYAGLKDARAVTRQTLCIEHVDPARVAALRLPDLRVLSVTRHRNKLKVGHLWGNRFVVRLRDVPAAAARDIEAILDVLRRRGVPNYFGPQRFGTRGDTWQIGRALLRGDPVEALSLFCGRPTEHDNDAVRQARRCFDAGDYRGAAAAWPPNFTDPRAACGALADGRRPREALRRIRGSLLRLFTSAFQSWLFNGVLAQRIASLDRLMVGDLAWRHAGGAVFRVEDLDAEQPRADAMEISPSGPLFGRQMTQPHGRPAEIERAVLDGEGLRIEALPAAGPGRLTGARRPLRVPLGDATVSCGQDDAGQYVALTFHLPAGSYATALLREVVKDSSRPSG